jgi:hypothetical protein
MVDRLWRCRPALLPFYMPGHEPVAEAGLEVVAETA